MTRLISGFLLLLAMSSLGGLTACNTVQGAGEDIERAGEGVQDAATPSEPEDR